MTATTNRFLLREVTRQHHEQLDAEVGNFEDGPSYARYVVAMSCFRDALEPQLHQLDYHDAFGEWRPTLICEQLVLDVLDLEAEASSPAEPVVVPDDMSGQLGIFYVLEGSTLGARVLVKRAAALGYDAQFGARHLSAQTANHGSWAAFQTIVDSAPGFDIDRAATAAIQTFQMAYQAFKRKRYAGFQG